MNIWKGNRFRSVWFKVKHDRNIPATSRRLLPGCMPWQRIHRNGEPYPYAWPFHCILAIILVFRSAKLIGVLGTS